MDETNELQNSLEDWIAIKANLFGDQSTEKFHFLVAFNDVDNIVAITGIEQTRKAKDRHNKSMATSLRYRLIPYLKLFQLIGVNQSTEFSEFEPTVVFSQT